MKPNPEDLQAAEAYLKETYAGGVSTCGNYAMHFGPNDMKKAYVRALLHERARQEELLAEIERLKLSLSHDTVKPGLVRCPHGNELSECWQCNPGEQ